MRLTSSRILGAACSLGLGLALILPACADTITPVTISYTSAWSGEINGTAMTTGSESGTGNEGTGLSFSDSTGQFHEITGGGSLNLTGLSIALGNASSVDTLINEFWGDGAGNTAATLQFTNSNSDTYSVSLVTGATARDYNNDGYVNTLSGSSTGVTAEQWWGTNDAANNGNGEDSQRLDAQIIALPTAWGGTDLTGILISNPSSVNPYAATLSAITVDSAQSATVTPEPASMLLLGTGALALLGLAWRRRLA